MIILNTSTGGQTFKIIPRSAASSPTFELLDKSTRVSSNIGIDVTNANGYMTITGFFSLKEGRFYTFKVKDGSTIIYRGAIFCTDQTNFNIFDVHSGEYTTENSYDNDFVIL
jgi:hypothetical protein|tara:strand:+ start:3009 stop:3344 length:336 start_codon:yes stop_codon:yes gene_type:complete